MPSPDGTGVDDCTTVGELPGTFGPGRPVEAGRMPRSEDRRDPHPAVGTGGRPAGWGLRGSVMPDWCDPAAPGGPGAGGPGWGGGER